MIVICMTAITIIGLMHPNHQIGIALFLFSIFMFISYQYGELLTSSNYGNYYLVDCLLLTVYIEYLAKSIVPLYFKLILGFFCLIGTLISIFGLLVWFLDYTPYMYNLIWLGIYVSIMLASMYTGTKDEGIRYIGYTDTNLRSHLLPNTLVNEGTIK